MIKELWQDYQHWGGKLLKEWPWSLLTFAAYGFLSILLYLFLLVREGTGYQVLLSITLLVVSFGWFLFLQGLAVGLSSGEEQWRSRFSQTWCAMGRLVLATLPVLALLFLCLLMIHWGEAFWPALSDSTAATTRSGSATARAAASPPTFAIAAWLWGGWKTLLLGFLLPLLALHSWILAWPNRPISVFRRMGVAFALAFSLRSLLAYLGGFFLFAGIPWMLIVFHHHWANPWVELLSLGLRLLLAFGFIVFGSTLTLAVLNQPLADSTKS